MFHDPIPPAAGSRRLLGSITPSTTLLDMYHYRHVPPPRGGNMYRPGVPNPVKRIPHPIPMQTCMYPIKKLAVPAFWITARIIHFADRRHGGGEGTKFTMIKSSQKVVLVAMLL